MVGGFADFAVDGVGVVETAFTFKTRNFKQRHVEVEVEDDRARWVTVIVDGYPAYFETCGTIYLRSEHRRISSPTAPYTQTLDEVE